MQKLQPKLRFPEYKSEWVKTHLGSLFSITAGGDIKSEYVSQEKDEIFKYPIYANAEKNKGLYGYSSIYKIDGGVITIAGRGNIGIAHARKEKFYPIVRLLVLKPKSSLSIDFFEFAINNFNIVVESTGVPQLTAPQISNYLISFPDLPEQTKIASFLSTVDEKIAGLKKQLTLLERYKKGVMQKIFAQELRFQDENGNDFSDWEEKKLGEVCLEHKVKNSEKNIDEVFSVAKHKGVINQIEHLGRPYSANDISHYKIAFHGDLIYTKSPTSDFPFGIIKQNKTGRNGVVSPLYCVLKPLNFALGSILHEYFLSSINTYNYLAPLVQKGAKNTMNINNNDFLNGASIKLPVEEFEQQKIATFLSSIYDKLEKCQGQIKAIESWKKGLLQQMFC